MSALDGMVGGGAALRAAREHLAQVQKAREALDTSPAGKGASMLCVTTSLGSYPQAASAVYALATEECDADDTEGASATYTDDNNNVIFGINLGSSVPPQGTRVIVHGVGGRWCFRYDG